MDEYLNNVNLINPMKEKMEKKRAISNELKQLDFLMNNKNILPSYKDYSTKTIF